MTAQNNITIEVKMFLMQVNDLLGLIDEIENSYAPDHALAFCEAIQEKALSMAKWAEENNRVTDKMDLALSNMVAGVRKWVA